MADIGREHLEHAWRRGNVVQRKLLALQDRLQGGTKKVVSAIEVSVAAGVGGLIQGKAGPEGSHIVGIPTDALLGVALVGLGCFNAAGKEYSDHLSNLGEGFLASFVSSVGFGWGNAWRETGKFHFGGKPTGALPAGTGVKGDFSPGQMADIVARVRAAAGQPV